MTSGLAVSGQYYQDGLQPLIYSWLFYGTAVNTFTTWVSLKDSSSESPGYVVPANQQYTVRYANVPMDGIAEVAFTPSSNSFENQEVVFENCRAGTLDRAVFYTGELWVPCPQTGTDTTFQWYGSGNEFPFWKVSPDYTDEFNNALMYPYIAIDFTPITVANGDSVTIPAGALTVTFSVLDGLDVTSYGLEILAAYLSGYANLPAGPRYIGLYDETGTELTVTGYERKSFPGVELGDTNPPYYLTDPFELGDACEVHGWRIYDALTAGNVIVGSEFDEHPIVEAGDLLSPFWPSMAFDVSPTTSEDVYTQ
jgi:hypothetical protein